MFGLGKVCRKDMPVIGRPVFINWGVPVFLMYFLNLHKYNWKVFLCFAFPTFILVRWVKLHLTVVSCLTIPCRWGICSAALKPVAANLVYSWLVRCFCQVRSCWERGQGLGLQQWFCHLRRCVLLLPSVPGPCLSQEPTHWRSMSWDKR